MSRLYVYAAIVAATLGLAAWAAASIYSAGKVAGAADCEQAHAKAAAEAQAESTRREQASSDARTTMLDYLGRIPTIEVRSHEAAERVRIIYRDSPAVCVADRPERVQSEIDAAYSAATSAVRAVRQPNAGSPANGP